MLECHDTNLEVRVQLSGVSSRLKPCGFGGQKLKSLGLVAGTLTHRVILSSQLKHLYCMYLLLWGKGMCMPHTHTHTRERSVNLRVGTLIQSLHGI